MADRFSNGNFFSRQIGKLKTYIKKKYNMEDRQAFGFCYLMVILPVITFCVFWLYLNIDSVFLAFQDGDGNFTLDNFKQIWTAFVAEDKYGFNLWDMLLQSWLFWIICRFCWVVQTLSTYILYKRIPGHYIFRTIFMIPSVLGGIVWTLIMKSFVAADGPILQWVNMMGIEVSLDVQMKGFLNAIESAVPTLLLIQVLPAIFQFSFVLSGAFARIGDEMFEVGKLEGIGFIREFITISIPLVWPTIIITIIGWFSSIFTQDNGAFLYTNGKHGTASVGFYLFYLAKSITDEGGKAGLYGYPSALGVLFTAITVPIVMVTRHFLEKVHADVSY